MSTDDFAARGGDAGWLNVTSLNERIVAAIRSLPDQGVTAPLKFETPGAKTVWFILRREGWRAPGAAPSASPRCWPKSSPASAPWRQKTPWRSG